MPNLIEKLRSDEFAAIDSGLVQDRCDQTLKSLDERGAAQELVRQQYSGRYPFELLQNADDASAEAAGVGRARFVLTDSALLVADDGDGFGDEQIKAICSLGRSSKDPRKAIGYKGLGFKSVGEITDRPQVISGAHRFGFDEVRLIRELERRVGGALPDGQRLPVYAFPFPVAREDLGADADLVDRIFSDGYRTVMRLPFKAKTERSAVQAHLLTTLTPRLLLFLRATNELVLEGTTDDFSAYASRESNTATATEVLLESLGKTEHWRVYRREVDITPAELVAELGDSWRKVTRVAVAAAVPLDDNGRAMRGPTYPLHVYFPTEEATGFGCILQGDFVLELDRRHISRSPEAVPYNAWLAKQLAELVADDVAMDLASRHPQSAVPVTALAASSDASGFGAECATKIVEQLRNTPFIPSLDGTNRRPADALVLPSSVPNPHLAHRHLNLDDLGHLAIADIEADADARKFLTERLGVAPIGADEIVKRLQHPSDDHHSFFQLLVDWADALTVARFAVMLHDVECVLTESGRWVTPTDGVFFPRRGEIIRIPESLPVSIADVPDEPRLRGLMSAAGVHDFEWRALVTGRIADLVTGKDTKPALRDQAFAALRVYFETQGGGDQTIRAAISAALLPAQTADGTTHDLRRADQIYFSADWLGHDRLEQIYGPFDQCDFLASPRPDDAAQRRAEREFLAWLGVAGRPRINAAIMTTQGRYLTTSRRDHPHASIGLWWTQWLESEPVRSLAKCPQGHEYSQQIRASFVLDRFGAVLESRSRTRLGHLWRELADGWGETYQAKCDAIFHCQHSGHGGDRDRKAPSAFAMMLTESEWVPARLGNDPVLAAPRQVWRLASIPSHVASRIRSLEPALDQRGFGTFAESLGVVDTARPRPENLISLLDELADEASNGDTASPGISDAARWAMRTLNDALQNNSAPINRDVPLLARKAGSHLFVTKPLIAEDQLLADAFGTDFAILDADRGLSTLTGNLGLRSLDKEVLITPMPSGVIPDDRVIELVREITRAKPYLVAAASAQVPSRRDGIVRGLARLELNFCRKLVLRYEFDHSTRDRSDAASYIAERLERIGSSRRRIGTAHIEIDTSGDADWFTLGPQIANFLQVPTQGDAFGLLLAGDDSTRRQYLAARHVQQEDVDEARLLLKTPPDDEIDLSLLDDLVLLDTSSADDQQQDQEAPTIASPDALTPQTPKDATSGASFEMPDLDLEHIKIVDAAPGAVMKRAPRPSFTGGLGPTSPVDHAQREQLQRELGHRGEKAAIAAERQRLGEHGIDPSAVVWRSETHEFAPYDIESIDVDGQRIYIEVKATTDDDPCAPFNISAAELQWALNKGDRYYIYRVTDINSAEPLVTRFRDPVHWLSDGRAIIRLSDATMRFSQTVDT